VGSRVPIIVSVVTGILGKEACNDKAGEVRLHSTSDDELFDVANFAILLTIGYLPGMKVDIIPVIQAKGESGAEMEDKFVMDIRNYMSMVSGHAAAPACLILFAVNSTSLASFSVLLLDYIQFYDYFLVYSCFIGEFVGGYSCHRTCSSQTGYEYCLMVHLFNVTS
jgi:hypothetical protein